MKYSVQPLLKHLITIVATLVIGTASAFSADVSLQWDPNVPAPEGYRVFVREAGRNFNYDNPIWEKSLTTCTLTGLVEGTTYYFVVRAFDGDLESVDSQEVSYTPPLVVVDTDGGGTGGTDVGGDGGTDGDTGTGDGNLIDSDGDNVPDVLDRFPADSTEWADNDNDGIGDNQDQDDDNDGMTDAWEIANGLDPLTDDAALDADGDGLSNGDEFLADTDPGVAVGNSLPEAPVIDSAVPTERVGLTPVLFGGAYVDADNDDHTRSRWQISTESDFSTLILDETSTTRLTAYTVGHMVLDVDTVYYWRVRYVDANSGASEWSATGMFTTIAADDSDDADANGIPDAQEVEGAVDVNENGIADVLEATIMSVNTVEGQAVVGVERLSDTITLVAIKSLPSSAIPDPALTFGFGLVGFKLYLQDGVDTATVNIHFSKPMPKGAKVYKHTPDAGWQAYDNAVFAANRKRVTLVLEDGGVGDEDGVRNGVIVDPFGITSADTATDNDGASLITETSVVGGGSGGSCFISAGSAQWAGPTNDTATTAMAVIMLLLAASILCAAVDRIRR